MEILQPRGLRNCNPGNIRINKDKWKGLRKVQTDESFFQFEHVKWGYRALLRVLQNYRRRHGCQTIADFINRWAPPCENNTGGYIARVCEEMQVPDSYVPDVYDKNTMVQFAAAIALVENGTAPHIEDIEAGWDLL